MSFSSYYPSSSGGGGIERGNGEDSGAGSEEGFEPAKSSETRRSSGSKRGRAAEVHNMSEKRRRGRINEKMKALQNLIPNSNKKTDKASMLDEAIEYLKQLQLQVQMLSMRNGLNVHPMYLPGAMQPLQASQLMGFGENTSAMSMAMAGLLPLSQDSSTHNSFNLSSHCTSSHQPIILSNNVANNSAPETSFGMESSQSHHRSFQLQAPAEGIYTEDLLPHQRLVSGQTARNLPENEMKTMALGSSSRFVGQASSAAEQNDHLEGVLPKDHPVNNQIFMQHLDGLQTGTSFKACNVKTELLEF